MKKLFWNALIAFAICLSAFSASYSESFKLPEYINVGLKYGASAVSSAVISSENGIILGTFDDDDFDKIFDFGREKSIILKADSADSDGIAVTDLSGNILYRFDSSDEYYFISSDDFGDNTVLFDNIPYRGGIKVIRNAGGKLTVINRLKLQEYLYGVVPEEMPPSWNKEALKAQAVAARNFVAANLNIHAGSGFDVCAASHCQVYGGFAAEDYRTNEAVDETEGIIMEYDGKPVMAYYHKNSGGYTENSENIWTAALGYLRGVYDPFTPTYSWKASITFDQMEAKLRSAGFNPGSIESVAIKSRTDCGSVKELEIKGLSNTIVLQKDNIRKILGFDLIKSLKFNIAGSDSPKYMIVADSDFCELDLNGAKRYAVSGDEVIKRINSDSAYIFNGFKKVKLSAGDVSDQTGSDIVCFEGTGAGHFLGMSQDGAKTMGEQGFDFEEILKFYYTDVEIIECGYK